MSSSMLRRTSMSESSWTTRVYSVSEKGVGDVLGGDAAGAQCGVAGFREAVGVEGHERVLGLGFDEGVVEDVARNAHRSSTVSPATPERDVASIILAPGLVSPFSSPGRQLGGFWNSGWIPAHTSLRMASKLKDSESHRTNPAISPTGNGSWRKTAPTVMPRTYDELSLSHTDILMADTARDQSSRWPAAILPKCCSQEPLAGGKNPDAFLLGAQGGKPRGQRSLIGALPTNRADGFLSIGVTSAHGALSSSSLLSADAT
ncbi:hypothetical protein G7046_g8445 [Stylonectria norvegica]|nr:hypothetical protein G7046_g8445 [Stylonectria norvegica]